MSEPKSNGDARGAPLPEPLVPQEVDLRDFDGIILNVGRLMTSEIMALSTGEEFKAAVRLWCFAWEQVPAGSLPNDETLLARFAGNTRRWKAIRAMALRGFVLCLDGRLYHKVLCEYVAKAWAKKLERREQTRAATEARKARSGIDKGENWLGCADLSNPNWGLTQSNNPNENNEGTKRNDYRNVVQETRLDLESREASQTKTAQSSIACPVSPAKAGHSQKAPRPPIEKKTQAEFDAFADALEEASGPEGGLSNHMRKIALDIFIAYRFDQVETLKRVAEEEFGEIDPSDQPERHFVSSFTMIRRLHRPARGQ